MNLMEEQLKLARKPTLIPEIKPPPPPLPAAPPATQVSGEAAQAAEEERRKAGRRTNTARGTLFAGETGGYRSKLGGGATLLG